MSSQLTVKNVTLQDDGVFKCIAKDHNNEIHNNLTLTSTGEHYMKFSAFDVCCNT